MTPSTSTIHIPVHLSLHKLEKLLNEQIGEVLFADAVERIEDLHVTVKRTADIRLGMEGQNLRYQIPLDVAVQKTTTLMTLKGEGALVLDFATHIAIEEDWNLRTTTALQHYVWSRKPVLIAGGIEIPIKGVLDQLVRRTKERLEDNIDEQIRNRADLKTQVHQAWKVLQQPILVASDYNTWLLVHPQSVGMSPLLTKDNKIQSTLQVNGFSEVYLGQKPATQLASELPAFRTENTDNQQIQLAVKAGISYVEANRQVNQLLGGKRFTQSGQTVQIDQLHIRGRGGDLFIQADLSGDFKGQVELEGKPYYDPRKKRLQVDGLEMEVKTKNFFYKAAAMLFKRQLINLIQESLSFPVDEKIEEMRQLANQQINQYQLPNGIELKGKIHALDIQKTVLDEAGLTLFLAGAGELAVYFE